MLIEIPDPDVILGLIISFIIGLIGLYTYYKIRPLIKTKNEMIDLSQVERLEYYEKQLIDMKIRLDAIEIEGSEQKTGESNLEIQQLVAKLIKNIEVVEKPINPVVKKEVKEESNPVSSLNIPKFDHSNAVDFVLHLITNKAMTSRDIQITLKRSREHVSRLMKKLFDDGYVNRNTSSKPYKYSITEKGKEKIRTIQFESIPA